MIQSIWLMLLLENLPSLKVNDDQKFIQLVDILEKGLIDLEAIDAKQEIANAYTVKIIESKISRQSYLTWLKEEEMFEDDEITRPNRSRFYKMYAFLEDEMRRRMKLMKRSTDRPVEKLNWPVSKRQNSCASYGSQGVSSDHQKPSFQKCLIHDNATLFTRKCRAFPDKKSEERASLVKETKGCRICLSISHLGNPCPFKVRWGPCEFTGCGKFHPHLLHDAENKGLLMCANSPPVESASVKSTLIANSDVNHTNALLLTQEIPTINNGQVLTVVQCR